jgi:hypothetical protein
MTSSPTQDVHHGLVNCNENSAYRYVLSDYVCRFIVHLMRTNVIEQWDNQKTLENYRHLEDEFLKNVRSTWWTGETSRSICTSQPQSQTSSTESVLVVADIHLHDETISRNVLCVSDVNLPPHIASVQKIKKKHARVVSTLQSIINMRHDNIHSIPPCSHVPVINQQPFRSILMISHKKVEQFVDLTISKTNPGTVRSILSCFADFINFLLYDLDVEWGNIMTAQSSYGLTAVKRELKLCLHSIKCRGAKINELSKRQKYVNQMNDMQDLLSQDDIAQFENSKHVISTVQRITEIGRNHDHSLCNPTPIRSSPSVTRVNTFQTATINTRQNYLPPAHTHIQCIPALSRRFITESRNVILTLLLLRNVQRSGCLAEFTLSQFTYPSVVSTDLHGNISVTCNGSTSVTIPSTSLTHNKLNLPVTQNTVYVSGVINHKTFNTHGPANVVMEKWLRDVVQVYVDFIRPLTCPTLDPLIIRAQSSPLFYTTAGKSLSNGYVSQAIGSAWNRAGITKPFLSATNLRKSVVTLLHSMYPDIRSDLATLMTHKLSTAETHYRSTVMHPVDVVRTVATMRHVLRLAPANVAPSSSCAQDTDASESAQKSEDIMIASTNTSHIQSSTSPPKSNSHLMDTDDISHLQSPPVPQIIPHCKTCSCVGTCESSYVYPVHQSTDSDHQSFPKIKPQQTKTFESCAAPVKRKHKVPPHFQFDDDEDVDNSDSERLNTPKRNKRAVFSKTDLDALFSNDEVNGMLQCAKVDSKILRSILLTDTSLSEVAATYTVKQIRDRIRSLYRLKSFRKKT